MTAQFKTPEAAEAALVRPASLPRRASSWRRKGPRVVVQPTPVALKSVAFDAVAVLLGLGAGILFVTAITVFSTL